MNLSYAGHFTLAELLRGSGRTSAPEYVVTNARRTAELLEVVRRQLGDVPMDITSWWRPESVNADTVGAARDSSHISGYGVDFTVRGMTPGQVLARLAPGVKTIPVDQVIDERDHTHISADPRMRRQLLVEPREGVYIPWQGQGGTGPVIAPASPVLPSSPARKSPSTWLVPLGILVALVPIAYRAPRGGSYS